VSTPPRASRPVTPRPGDVLKIQEENYRYGLGELVLRVTQVRSVRQLADGEWLTVVGVQLAWNGSDLEEREVLVRLNSLVRRPRRP
jgi:hypothetical protein